MPLTPYGHQASLMLVHVVLFPTLSPSLSIPCKVLQSLAGPLCVELERFEKVAVFRSQIFLFSIVVLRLRHCVTVFSIRGGGGVHVECCLDRAVAAAGCLWMVCPLPRLVLMFASVAGSVTGGNGGGFRLPRCSLSDDNFRHAQVTDVSANDEDLPNCFPQVRSPNLYFVS